MKNKFSTALVVGLITSQALADVPRVEPKYNEKVVEAAVEKTLDRVTKKDTAADLRSAGARDAISRYMSFLQIDPTNEKVFKNTLSRILESSTQMILCPSVVDWECLEKKPQITPTAEFRRDTDETLGQPVLVNEPLRLEYFFTKRWADAKRGLPSNNTTVAEIFGQKIRNDAKNFALLALYGIDDISGSMAPVYNAIEEKVNARVPVFGVFDVTQESAPNAFLRDYNVKVTSKSLTVDRIDELDFSYVSPKHPDAWVWGRPDWMEQLIGLDPKSMTVKVNSETGVSKYERDLNWLANPKKAAEAIRLTFQYNGTMNLMRLLNRDARDNNSSRARMEFPMETIMHNKFAVLDNGGQKSVWTGTTNVSRTCMGDESNSNMAIYIKNNEVAKTFMAEFQEMFDVDPENTRITKAKNLVTGRFHSAKRPNTKRYFRFADGHELRVHFAPTDDGEHRAILPLLLSARKGDRIRVSMFGAGGIEYVRAFQYAAAQGAKVQVLLDSVTGASPMGWMKDKTANLFDENPYSANAEPIEVKISTWVKKGLNHHKTASLTRFEKGQKNEMRAEALVIGSQNWSASGNDLNDENMVTIRHLKRSLEPADAFNREFDENMWPLAQTITKEIIAKKKAEKDSKKKSSARDDEETEEPSEE